MNGKLDYLDEPVAGQRAPDAAAHRLHGSEADTRGGRRKHARNVLVAHDPRDLLDQVERVVEVGPPGRDSGRQRVRSGLDRAPDGLQVGDRRVRRDVHPGDSRRQVERDRDHRRLGRHSDDGGARLDGAAAISRQELAPPARPLPRRWSGPRRARCACPPRR